MSKTMKIVVFVILFMVAIMFVRDVFAQESVDLVPRWTHGPSLAAYAVAQDDNGLYHGNLLTAGAGWRVGVAFVDGESFPWIQVDMPWHAGADTATDSFFAATGLVLTIAGNIGVGATYDLIETRNGIGYGLMLGNSSWKNNGTILLQLTAAWGNPNGSLFALGK